MMSRRATTAFALDVIAIIVFVAIGRRSHHEAGGAVVGTARVAAPFLIAAVLGWLAARAWRDPFGISTGAIVWLVTVIAGMFLRHFAFDRGTATAFVIVATATLGAFIMGWRGIARWLLERSAKV